MSTLWLFGHHLAATPALWFALGFRRRKLAMLAGAAEVCLSLLPGYLSVPNHPSSPLPCSASTKSRVNREMIASAVRWDLHSDVLMVVRLAGPRSACSGERRVMAIRPLDRNCPRYPCGFRRAPLAHVNIGWPFVIGLVGCRGTFSSFFAAC